MISKKHVNFLDYGIFHGSCLFVCAYTYNEMLSHFKKRKTPEGWVEAVKHTQEEWDRNNWGFASKVWVDDVSYSLLILKHRFDFKDTSHANLAHEVLHSVSFHLKDFLDPIAENEAFCYTHTHLMNQCYKILRS